MYAKSRELLDVLQALCWERFATRSAVHCRPLTNNPWEMHTVCYLFRVAAPPVSVLFIFVAQLGICWRVAHTRPSALELNLPHSWPWFFPLQAIIAWDGDADIGIQQHNDPVLRRGLDEDKAGRIYSFLVELCNCFSSHRLCPWPENRAG